MIEIHDLRKVYPSPAGDVVALDGVDLVVPRGAVHGVVGRSGAGKSTLVRCLTGLERPTAGRVVVAGEDLAALPAGRLRDARRTMGMVFQHVNLLDSRTVAGNVAFPLEVAGTARRRRAERVQELLELVGLGDRADSYPAQLSGGQRQRVGIARALATEPDVLLCDEPTSALDGETTRQILRLVADLRDRLGITVLVITHEMAVVREICDSVTLLEGGRAVQSGSLADVLADHGSPLARALVPVPDLREQGRTLVEVTYAADGGPGSLPGGGPSAGPRSGDALRAVADAASASGPPAEVLSGTIETVAGLTVGRLLVALPDAAAVGAVARLRAAGLHADVVRPGVGRTDGTPPATLPQSTGAGVAR
jgi:D-methionine transport system ATP-binding protein